MNSFMKAQSQGDNEFLSNLLEKKKNGTKMSKMLFGYVKKEILFA